jgi:hypothetical protein
MKKPQFVTDDKTTERLQKQHDAVQKQIAEMPEENRSFIRSAQAQVDAEITKTNSDIFDNYDHEERIRASGYQISEAEEIARIVRKVGVGQIFEYKNKLKVMTPFKTVVDAQTYVSALQDRLLQTTTIPVELEITQLKDALDGFTSLSFFGLIGLAFKRYFNGETR